MKRLPGESVTIVLGALVALGVDEWRQGRTKLKIAAEHLADITANLRATLVELERWGRSAVVARDGIQPKTRGSSVSRLPDVRGEV